MEEKAYVVQVGMHHILANSQEHAFKLIELLSQAQPVDMTFAGSDYRISHSDRLSVGLVVRPLDDVDAEHL